MHIPDGIITAQTSGAAGVLAAGALGTALYLGREHLSERQRDLIGPVAATVFAAQMVNVPIGGGTSGHLLGGALAAAVIGPVGAMLAMAAVIATQALIFGDGGVAALGINLLLMAVIAPLAGAGLQRLGTRMFPSSTSSVTGRSVNAGISAFGSVMAAVVGYLVIHEVGATVAFSGRSIASAMVITHLGVAALEAGITAMAVAALSALAPSASPATVAARTSEPTSADTSERTR